MEKINFENLPSTNTPLDADTLNGMQSNIEKSVVAVGKTQPSTSENVWIKKGKNLFNLEKLISSRTNHGTNQWTNSSLKFVSAGNYSFSRNVYTIPAELLNKQVTLSFNAVSSTNISSDTIRNSIFISTTGNESGDVLIQALTTTNNRYTATFTPTIQNLQITLYATLSDSTTQVTMTISDIQLEQNSTATTFEPYIKKEILVKNGNSLYENFYNEDNYIQPTILGNAVIDTSYISYTEVNLFVKKGNIVRFDFTVQTTGTWSNTTKFATGLPKPASGSYLRFVGVDTSAGDKPIRFSINANGEVTNWYSATTPPAGHLIEGGVTYITTD